MQEQRTRTANALISYRQIGISNTKLLACDEPIRVFANLGQLLPKPEAPRDLSPFADRVIEFAFADPSPTATRARTFISLSFLHAKQRQSRFRWFAIGEPEEISVIVQYARNAVLKLAEQKFSPEQPLVRHPIKERNKAQ